MIRQKGDVEKNLRDISTLMKVDTFRTIFLAKLEEAKVSFLSEADKYFTEKVDIIPFPGKNTHEYRFTLHKNSWPPDSPWKAEIKEKEVHIPWESILPYSLIQSISSFPVDSDKTQFIPSFRYEGSVYNIFFIKYIDHAVVGIIQKVKAELESNDKKESPLDISQFINLPKEKQLEIFFNYFNNYSDIQEKVLFDFFVTILPSSEAISKTT